MPAWGFWSLFFAVSVACLLLARRLDRTPDAPPREPEDAHRPSLPDALQGTPPPPREAAQGGNAATLDPREHDRPSRPAR